MKRTLPIIIVCIAMVITERSSAQADSIFYHDHQMESQWGSSSNNDIFRCYVRFTPPVYPATLVGMRAWFRNADPSSTCRWVIFKDPSGAAAGGVNLAYWDAATFTNPAAGGAANQAYSVYKDMSSNPVTITSGDVYIGATQYLGFFGMAIDNVPNNSIAPNRQWTQQYGNWMTLASQAYNGQFGITAYFTPFMVSTGEINEEDISIFPNPVSDVLNISLPEVSKKANIKIYNVLGELILSTEIKKGTAHIDIQSLNQGIYTLIIDFDTDIFIRKIIKR